jgi:endonuclease/exonuclease/phosphatase family metal-dependent hydrolase
MARSRVLRVLVALQLLALVVVAVLLQRYADVLWPATLIMYSPRWIWGAPLVVLVPLALRRERRLLVPLAIAAGILIFPILDLRVPVRRLSRDGATRPTVRAMTYNIGGGYIDPDRLAAYVAELRPDVVALQEHEGPIHIKGLNGTCDAELCLSSRFPIARKDKRDRSDLLAQHGSGSMIRYELTAPSFTLNVTNVHLATVRNALGEARRSPRRTGEVLGESARERRLESQTARAWAERGVGPVLVMGDFNIPVESAVYRENWASFHNAFSEAGFGFGSSKRTRWHGVRIDHVLAGPGWEVLRAWIGPGMGGDHRPMLADLRWIGG